MKNKITLEFEMCGSEIHQTGVYDKQLKVKDVVEVLRAHADALVTQLRAHLKANGQKLEGVAPHIVNTITIGDIATAVNEDYDEYFYTTGE